MSEKNCLQWWRRGRERERGKKAGQVLGADSSAESF